MLSDGADEVPALAGRERLHLRQRQQHSSVTGVLRGSPVAGGGRLVDPAADDEQPAQQRQREQHGRPAERVQPAAPPSAAVDHAGPGSAAASAIGGERLDRGARLRRRGAPSRRQNDSVARPSRSSTPPRRLAQLAADVGGRQRREVREQQHLALLVGQVVQRVEHRLLLGADALLAVPQAGDVAALGDRPGAGAHPLLRVGEPAHLAPVVPGDDERVATAVAGRREVTGQGVGGQHQPAPAGEVEVVEVEDGLGRPSEEWAYAAEATRVPHRTLRDPRSRWWGDD